MNSYLAIAEVTCRTFVEDKVNVNDPTISEAQRFQKGLIYRIRAKNRRVVLREEIVSGAPQYYREVKNSAPKGIGDRLFDC